jgi:hypothetical protein
VGVVARGGVVLPHPHQGRHLDRALPQGGHELPEEVGEYGVAGGGDHGRVQRDVGVDEGRFVPGGRHAAAGRRGVQGGDVLRCAAGGGEAGRLHLHQDPTPSSAASVVSPGSLV